MKKKYWIRYCSEECVLCGVGTNWTERVYDKPKPEKVEDRYWFRQYVCDNHYDYFV
jgi:hypothetical protein